MRVTDIIIYECRFCLDPFLFSKEIYIYIYDLIVCVCVCAIKIVRVCVCVQILVRFVCSELLMIVWLCCGREIGNKRNKVSFRDTTQISLDKSKLINCTEAFVEFVYSREISYDG